MKRTLHLISDAVRERAVQAVRDAPAGWFVQIGPEGRSPEQGKLFHALCDDIVRSGFRWAGKRPNARQVKILFISAHAVATRADCELVAGLEGEPVLIRESTAHMSHERMNSLIEYTLAWCALNGVPISQQEQMIP